MPQCIYGVTLFWVITQLSCLAPWLPQYTHKYPCHASGDNGVNYCGDNNGLFTVLTLRRALTHSVHTAYYLHLPELYLQSSAWIQCANITSRLFYILKLLKATDQCNV